MHKFFLALILLSVPISTSALAHSGTEQDEKACAPDVQRFCRKLMDQGDFTILACLKENRPKLSAACRSVLSQPRAMTIGFLFGAGGLPSLNRGLWRFGNLVIRISRKKPAPFAHERSTPCRSPVHSVKPIEGPLLALSRRSLARWSTAAASACAPNPFCREFEHRSLPYGYPLRDQAGNLSPNIGRPLRDCSRVASSWMTSQCSASTSILHAHDVGDDPRRRQAVTAEPPVENDEIAGRRRNVVLVAQRRGQGLDQVKEPVTAGRNMCAVLDVTRRPEALGGSVVALVEKGIKCVQDGLDAGGLRCPVWLVWPWQFSSSRQLRAACICRPLFERCARQFLGNIPKSGGRCRVSRLRHDQRARRRSSQLAKSSGSVIGARLCLRARRREQDRPGAIAPRNDRRMEPRNRSQEKQDRPDRSRTGWFGQIPDGPRY